MGLPMKPLLSVVITSYNDREIIEPHFEAIVNVLQAQDRFAWELIYVDDGSTDGSVATLEQIATRHDNVFFVELARNFGQQKAFFRGMQQARGGVVVTLDGDFQYNPECLIRLANLVLEGYDIVSGVRHSRKDPLWMTWTSRFGQGLMRKILQANVSDFGSVKGFSRFIVGQILKYETYCVSVYGTAYALTNRYTEIPVEHKPRPAGRSKWTAFKRLHLLFDVFLGFGDFTMVTLTKIGAGFALAGLSILFCLLYLYLAHKMFLFDSVSAIAAYGFLVGGLSLVFFSFGLSFFLRIHRILLWKGEVSVIRDIYSQERRSLADAFEKTNS